MDISSKIYVAGHNGMVGQSLHKLLLKKKFGKIITANRQKLNLENTNKVYKFIKKNKPHIIINCAGKVGGIMANKTYPTQFLNENIQIQSNLIKSAYLNNIEHFINLGSSCIYPKKSKQPIKESYLLSGKLEETNDSYAIAKIAGVKMCESYNDQYKTNYKCLMPASTFGPNDNYDTMNSHFIPALIKKIHTLKVQNKNELILWGNGLAKRELIYVDDIADACIHFMKKNIKETIINIGTGKDFTITHFAKIILKNIMPKKNIKIKYDI